MPATRHDVDRKHDSTHNNTHTRRALVLEVQQPDSASMQAHASRESSGTAAHARGVGARHGTLAARFWRNSLLRNVFEIF